jgi:hypothetical protein
VEPDVVYANTTTDAMQQQMDLEQNEYANASVPLRASTKVSSKIQQLLHTLQRPRTKPLAEYYFDDDKELEGTDTFNSPISLTYDS